MPRFFITHGDVRDGEVRIGGDDARHLRRSLRVREGETVVVVEDGETEHGVRVTHISDDAVMGLIAWSRPAGGEPRTTVHVLIAVAAQEMDAAVRGLVVAGASAITPVTTERSVAGGAMSAGRLQRLRSIALQAAQLSGRARVPTVDDLTGLGDAVDALPRPCPILACVLGATTPIAVAPRTQRMAIVIGPEGGLSPQEVQALHDRGATAVHLGPRTLPHHLAGGVAVSLVLQAAGDLDASFAPPPADTR
jgi:16S rRNA (uracil1498-N3)-methyltransferase